MAHLNHRGPDEKGPKTGRKLGLCKKKEGETTDYTLGQGMAKQHKNTSCKESAKGKRLKAFER